LALNKRVDQIILLSGLGFTPDWWSPWLLDIEASGDILKPFKVFCEFSLEESLFLDLLDGLVQLITVYLIEKVLFL
jgi:hypothetical protein